MKLLKMNRQSGMSYIQMIATVVIVAVISGVAMMKMTNVSDVAEEQRLGVHVASLNSAVKLYVSSGGSLENMTSAQAVVDKMKTMASNSGKIAGFGGTFVDPRLRVIEQTDEDAAVSGQLRVIWDATNQSFRIADSGERGIKEFKIDPTASPPTIAVEERETRFELAVPDANQGAWVWDFDTETSASTSPLVTTAGGDTNLDINPNGNNFAKQQLMQPSLSPIPGTFNLNEFGVTGKEVIVSNPNSNEDSELYVSVKGAVWSVIADGGSVSVSPGESLSVFARVRNEVSEEYFSSYVRSGRYEATKSDLSAPSIATSASAFHPIDEKTVTVTITHGNNPDHGKAQYSLGAGGAWIDYTGPFDLAVEDHIQGTTIYAKSVATQWGNYYLPSAAVERVLPTNQHTLDEPTIAVTPSSLHPIDSDAVVVSLTDPNTDDGPISSLQYSLNGGDWMDYEEAVTLNIDDYFEGVDIEAKAIPIVLVGALLESDQPVQNVPAAKVTLDAPVLALSETDFHPLNHQTVTMTLTNPNADEVSALEYQIDGGDWVRYGDPVSLAVLDYLTGVDLNARAVATAHPANILNSSVEAASVGVLEATLVVPEIVSSAPVLNPQGYPTATITLTDPNSADFSRLIYSVDDGSVWSDYTEPFTLSVTDYPEGVTILARAEPTIIPELINMSATAELELPVPPKLEIPMFGRVAGGYVKSQYEQGITITSSNNASDAQIRYRVNEGDWEVYSDAIVLTSWPSTVEAYAGAVDYLTYQDSDTVSAVYERIYLTPNLAFSAEASGLPFFTHEFTGEAYGSFKNPIGDAGMVYVLENNYFEWGNSTGYLGFDNGSFLEYTGAAWENVQAGELFRLGKLDYFNGETYTGTQATDVTLDLTIALMMPDTDQSFDIDIALENTANLAGNTADQSADYVRISSLNTNFSATIDGIQYKLNLAFGYTGTQGFTTIDEFHVHEGATSTADLWGYFTTDDF